MDRQTIRKRQTDSCRRSQKIFLKQTIQNETMNTTEYIFAACGTLLALIVLLRKENGLARHSKKRLTKERAPRGPTITTVSEQTTFC